MNIKFTSKNLAQLHSEILLKCTFLRIFLLIKGLTLFKWNIEFGIDYNREERTL